MGDDPEAIMRDLASGFIDKINDKTKLLNDLVDIVAQEAKYTTQVEYLKNIADAVLDLTSKFNDTVKDIDPLLKELVNAVVKDNRHNGTELNEKLLEFIVVCDRRVKDIVSLAENATNAIEAVRSLDKADEETMKNLKATVVALITKIRTKYTDIITFATKAKTALHETSSNGGRMMTRRKHKKSNRTYKKGLTRRSRK